MPRACTLTRAGDLRALDWEPNDPSGTQANTLTTEPRWPASGDRLSKWGQFAGTFPNNSFMSKSIPFSLSVCPLPSLFLLILSLRERTLFSLITLLLLSLYRYGFLSYLQLLLNCTNEWKSLMQTIHKDAWGLSPFGSQAPRHSEGAALSMPVSIEDCAPFSSFLVLLFAFLDFDWFTLSIHLFTGSFNT